MDAIKYWGVIKKQIQPLMLKNINFNTSIKHIDIQGYIDRVKKIFFSTLSFFVKKLSKINFILITSCLLITVLFKEFFEEIIEEKIVIPFLKEATPTIWADYIWIALVSFFFIFCIIKFFKRYIVSNNLFLVILLSSLIYSYYRFIEYRFTFYGLTLANSIFYFDAILIIFSCITFLKFIPYNLKDRSNIPTVNSFIIDQPIKNSKEDRLEREKTAKELANRIISTNNTKAFAIGINGVWGSGKTSYLNLIKEALPSDVITVDFNPWRSLDSSSIIKDFFNALAGKLKNHSTEFSDIAKLYSQQLSNKEAYIYNLLNFTSFIKEEGLEEYYNRINLIIQKLNCKIIIFIDDLDRLDNKEIYEVLKLIRNTADFNFVSYVVAYDKKYINESIDSLLKDPNKAFLEKIFQVEHNLPFHEQSNILDILYENLCSVFPDQKEILDEKLIGKNGSLNERVSYTSIKTIRDAKRFLNSFIFHFEKIKGEVDFVDFFNLETLKLKYQSVYEDLFHKSHIYLSSYQNSKEKYVVFDDTKPNTIKEYLNKKKIELGLNENSIEEVISILNSIFRRDMLSRFKPQSIVLSKNFERYFFHSLDKKHLSENEFKVVINLPYEQITQRIDLWIEEGKRWELIERFERYSIVKDFNDQNDFEKIIKLVQHIANSDKDKHLSVNYRSYPVKDFFEKIYDGDRKITKSFYGGKDNEYKKFILSLFNESQVPHYFEVSLISFVLEKNYGEIIIPSEELRSILLNYLKNIISLSLPSFSNYEIYHTLRANLKFGSKEEVRRIFINYLNKTFLKYFLKHIIYIDPYYERDDNSEVSYSIDIHLILDIFINYEAFEEMILKHNGDLEIEEFKSFYYKWKETKTFTSYRFTLLPVRT